MTDLSDARQTMVDCQVRPSDVTQYAIIDAMLRVPREVFAPKSLRDIAYADTEIALGQGRVLLPPRTFAKKLEASQPKASDLVLDLAPGTGYSSAVLAQCAAMVIGIEPSEDLAKSAGDALGSLELDNVVLSAGDAAAGDPAHGPYDLIFVNGAVERIPTALTDQLKDGGRLVAIFRENGADKCRVLVRAGDAVASRYAFDASAPLLPGFEADAAFVF
jgi:protein-L-isoaspartate(D-aspartate) O-methyltransferase